MTISFFVPGIPVPKGSAKAFVNKHTGRASVVQTNAAKQKPWASVIALSAYEMHISCSENPVAIELQFFLPRPKFHFGKNGLKPNAPFFPGKKPDIDKLIRCVLDALTGAAWKDDSQVVEIWAQKCYSQNGNPPGCLITVRPILM